MVGKPFSLKVDDDIVAGSIFTIDISGMLNYKRQGVSTIVICHGLPAGQHNPDDKGYGPLIEELTERNFNVVYFNFRGCGWSGGDFSFGSWCKDLDYVLSYMRNIKSIKPSKTLLLGYSMGGAAAISATAQKRDLGGLITMAAPSDLTELFKESSLDEFIEHGKRVGFIKTSSFPNDKAAFYSEFKESNPIAKIGKISPVPVLFVHGSKDETVPAKCAEELFMEASEPKDIKIIENAGHRLRQYPESLEEVMKFIEQIDKNKTG